MTVSELIKEFLEILQDKDLLISFLIGFCIVALSIALGLLINY